MKEVTPINSDDLEKLIAHETRYFEVWSKVTRTAPCWFLDSADLPDYQSANRALRLRCTDEMGGGERERKTADEPESIVAEIIAHYRARGLAVVADVDPIAESLGFGRALRSRGVLPVADSTLLMRYVGETILQPRGDLPTIDHLTITRLPNETGAGEAREWISLAGCDEKDADDIAFWRAVAEPEARMPDCRLYLARVNGQAAGTCQLFSANGWAQLDSVMTHPAFRRLGIATRLVTRALQDSFALGNTTTYLFTDNGGAGERVYRNLGFEVWGVNILRRHLLW